MLQHRTQKIRSFFRWIAWVLVVQVVLMNISAAMYAYKFTHFSEGNAPLHKTSRNIITKTWKLFTGPTFYKQAKPATPFFSYENLQIQSGERTINAWYSAVDSPKGCILMFHGVMVNKGYMVHEAAAFREMGYNVMLVDLRGHGQSEGNITSFGVHETEEITASFDQARKKDNERIFLFGVSMGGGAVLKATSEKLVRPAGIIAEMPFGSLQDHVKSRARTLGFPAQPFGFLVTMWIGIQRGYNGFEHKVTKYAKGVDCPVLLQWGKKDRYVLDREIKEIFSNLPGKKKLVTYSEADHESLLMSDHIRWKREVAQFLEGLP
jgi:hypothetical protein